MRKCWREAVKEMRRELESVRSIANRTDNIPHLLIGVDKFIHWTDDLGAEGVPFPDWYNCLFPSLDSISDHPWLLTVERRYDATRIGLMVRQEASTTEPMLVATTTTSPQPATPTTSNVGASHAVTVDKGKRRVTPEQLEAMDKQVASRRDVNNDGESEVGERAVEMDEVISEPVRGRSKKRARSHSESRSRSTRRKSRSLATRRSRKDEDSPGEGTPVPSNPPTSPKPKYGRAQLAARTTPPPDPEACGTCINRKVVCTWTVGNVPCDPCRKRKIGCTKGTVRRPSTARTPKPPARRQATPTRRNPSRLRKPPTRIADDDTPAPPPRKKTRVSQDGQTPQSGAAASSSSAPQQRLTLVVRPLKQATSGYPVPPAIRPDSSSYTPLPAPPIPPSTAYPPPPAPTPPLLSPADTSSVSFHRRLDDIIQRQDQLLGRIDDVERRVARSEGRTSGMLQDRMQVLEHELADCRWTMATLTREMETLRANMHGAQPAQTTGPPPADEDLLDLLGPATGNTATDEAENSIAAELHGLVLTATPSGQHIGIHQPVREGSTLGPVGVEGGSAPVGNESGVIAAGNDAEGETMECAEDA
ncbi:hypothetical protein EDC04DRAFT_2892858 [Pisolithus marmoratus]|nr:hypothetical protein EDC04DRAFT_2892858 [Pisolithus marmoratus]